MSRAKPKSTLKDSSVSKRPADREEVAEQAARFVSLVRCAKNKAAESLELERDRNVATLIEFVECVEGDELPPRPLLKHLADVFRRYLSDTGGLTLDELLGAQKRPHGQTRYFRAVLDLDRNAHLMVELHLLVVEEGMSLLAAAKSLEENGVGKHWTTIRNLYTDPTALAGRSAWKDVVEEAYQELNCTEGSQESL